MIETLAPEYGYAPADIDITITDQPRNVRSHERVLSKTEIACAHENESIYAIPSVMAGADQFETGENFKPAEKVDRSSKDSPKIPKDVLTTKFEKLRPLQSELVESARKTL
jgi:hypothetical protein